MRSFTPLLALAATASAIQQGFNYGATNADGSCRKYEDFHRMYTRAQGLAEPGFTSARLYTSVQCGSQNAPIEAIKAALDTNTNLLLGVWASAGQDTVNQEVAALKQAVNNWGPQMKQKVVGISVGSEDLYRSSPQGVANNAGVGADAAAVVKYIKQVRQAMKGTALEGVRIGHVDTWTAWELPENVPVVNAVDWLGHNSFPYFETTKNNPIGQGKNLFNEGLSHTESAAKGKPVWVTETGWPSRGPKSNAAVASTRNQQKYWRQVGCSLFGRRNVWWYTLYDSNSAQTELSFSLVNGDTATKFPLDCP
ncbi:uncharacterized protein LTR77_004753 [Saxophila tyrrhenica]|uniref:Probable glucan endo-1,3-beta-glucosidase eglC n=1 Tax=Saxophila tyrrhenica TaxID=1690608 RepID=A0AAV9PEA8_9PEZI|nr:hypothetical protein LTR77_004753 [Saxophila tyrrhenica]